MSSNMVPGVIMAVFSALGTAVYKSKERYVFLFATFRGNFFAAPDIVCLIFDLPTLVAFESHRGRLV